MSLLRGHNNKTRGGLGLVCATGMYCSIEHVKFPKFQTGVFVEWKAPQLWERLMYRSNRSFNIPPGQPPGHLTFLKIIVQIPPYPGQNAVQMPHTRVHAGDQMPPARGHFIGTKMTEGRRKRLQLSNKIFINITKKEKHC